MSNPLNPLHNLTEYEAPKEHSTGRREIRRAQPKVSKKERARLKREQKRKP